ncbi:protein LURP-one-related 6-like [Iris pallida]|uniref:Protein LURP-one-related 6-like n=1 Tax=Iris pallida TaxID=29817 RepID=A0AAX6I7E5_IRIPA|nr:protein LURP-one-related 6-like [Iris pallida]
MGGSSNLVPVVSKIFCASSQTALTVRKRPQVVNGGGFVVLNGRNSVVFSVVGCGVLGANGELILKDGDGAPILYIRKKGGMLQALSAHNRWRGYLMEFGRPSKPVFSLREPRQLAVSSHRIKISVEPKGRNGDWDYAVEGSFDEKAFSIADRKGNVVAKVGSGEEKAAVAASKDFYRVVVQPGYDQAFVVGVIAVLDNIHGESTTC